ncbi:hypothetical protein OG21DRAFT_1514945 [Imleria badia]|nr:hypothetical protein OG21DRAFT_1514945 [Imleria badia]
MQVCCMTDVKLDETNTSEFREQKLGQSLSLIGHTLVIQLCTAIWLVTSCYYHFDKRRLLKCNCTEAKMGKGHTEWILVDD